MKQKIISDGFVPGKRSRLFEIRPSRRLLFETLSANEGGRIVSLFKGIPEPGLDSCFLDIALCQKYASDSVFRQKDKQGCDWIISNKHQIDIGILHLYYVHESRGKKVCTIGYALSPEFRGLGYANEAIQHLIFWLEQKGFSEIKAVTGKENKSSVILLKKNSFEPARKLKNRKGKWVTWKRKLN